MHDIAHDKSTASANTSNKGYEDDFERKQASRVTVTGLRCGSLLVRQLFGGAAIR
jgi:hypothetical protein